MINQLHILTAELTGLSDQYKLIATNGALQHLNAIRGTENYREQKASGVFLFLVETKYFCWNSEKNGKGLAGEFCSY